MHVRLSCCKRYGQLSRSCVPNLSCVSSLSCDHFKQLCTAAGKIAVEQLSPLRQNRHYLSNIRLIILWVPNGVIQLEDFHINQISDNCCNRALIFPKWKYWSILQVPRGIVWFAELWNPVTRQAIVLEGCSNPYGFSKSCSQNRKKNVFGFRLGRFWRWRHNDGMFWKFSPPLAGPGPQPIDPFFWLKVLLKTRSKSASIEPLIDLLAYL